MAFPTQPLIDVLRKTANRIAQSTEYQWGHMGACNCGHLAQEITQLPKGEIHRYAMQGEGDWNDQLETFCETSGRGFDEIVAEMIRFGFTTKDLTRLEKLNHPEVLAKLPFPMFLKKNVREDVAIYLHAWADLEAAKMLKLENPVIFDGNFPKKVSKRTFQIV
jgi:hypothetical protein